MTHQRHLMERGLSVEDDIIVVVQMSLNCVADFQMLISPVLQDGEVNVSTIDSFDVLSAGPVVSTSVNQGLQVLNVVDCDDFRHCEIHRNLNRHSKLVKSKVGVRSDDSTS